MNLVNFRNSLELTKYLFSNLSFALFTMECFSLSQLLDFNTHTQTHTQTCAVLMVSGFSTKPCNISSSLIIAMIYRSRCQ